MAITNEGVALKISKRKIPTGYVFPVVNEVDGDYVGDLSLNVVKSVVENADNKVTMDNILADMTTQIDAILAADYIASQTVTAHANLNDLIINHASVDGDDTWLSDTVSIYTGTLKLFVKTLP